MGKIIAIVATVVTLVFGICSCNTYERCPAYTQAAVEVEQSPSL